MSRIVVADFATRRPVSDDWLLGGRVRFRQPATGYRVAVDPVLLAAAVPARAGEVVLDVGSGSGAASLCLHHRVPDCQIVGLDVDGEMIALARENAQLNNAEQRVAFVHGDIVQPPAPIAARSFDHVFSNPPYLQAWRADRRSSSGGARDIAKIEESANLSLWIEAMAVAVKPKGRLTLIHRADRLDELLAELRRHAGEIAVFPLWPKQGWAAKRILVSARRGVASPLRLAPGLVLHQASGAYSVAAQGVLENGDALVI